MLNNSWFRKQKPFLGFSGYGGGGQGIVLGGAAGATVEASGGILSEYESGGDIYRVHTFVGPGTFTVTDVVGDGEIEYVLLSGGGGGGSSDREYSSPMAESSGGGGGGGFRTNVPGTPLSVSDPRTVEVGSYPVVIGQGARAGSGQLYNFTNRGVGSRGSDSYIQGPPTWTEVTATGGGGGGAATGTGKPGMYGGSGGGGGVTNPTKSPGGSGPGGAGNNSPTNTSSPGQGYDGGASAPQPEYGGGAGGGGGATTTGGPAPTGRNGAEGASMTIEDGSTTFRYGGGGGGGNGATPRSSSGGGGSYPLTITGRGGGGTIPTSGPSTDRQKLGVENGGAFSGLAGFGGGGGGSAQAGRGGTGGSGCVILRYKISKTTGTSKATGGSISYYPGSPISPTGAVIHTFRTPGTFTTPASFSENCDVWMIGGGGGGGCDGGGGGGAGYILDLPGHPIGNSFSTPVDVGLGGKGRGYQDFCLGFGMGMAGGFGTNSICPNISPTSPTGAAGGMGGNSGGSYQQRGNPTNDGNTGAAGTGNEGCGGGGSAGGSPNPPGSPGPVGAPYGGSDSPSAGGGGGGAGGPGFAAHGQTPTVPNNTIGGYGGIGVQCPLTFRNPLSSVGYPGPNGEGFWFGGGGAGGSASDNAPTHPAPMATGVMGGGPGTPDSPTGPYGGYMNPLYDDAGTASFHYYWAGGGNGRGVFQMRNISFGPPTSNHNEGPEVTRGCGGNGAANSGGGGGGGTKVSGPGMAYPGPSSSYRGFAPQGGDGGPGIVMIAYPQ